MRRLLQGGKKAVAVAVGIFAPMLLVMGTAWAQVGSSGTILGCVGNSGKLTAVDEATGSCKPGDVPLSWYTRDGANAAFLGNTAKAADADKLDGLDSTHFLGTGTPAGGALTGTYPNPSIAAEAIDSAAIRDGAVTAEKLAGNVALRSLGDSTFIPLPGELTPVIACGEAFKDVGSMPITVTAPSRIYASASVNWSRGATAMDSLRIRAFLHDATDTRIAQTPLDGISSVDANHTASANSSGVLLDDGGDRRAFVAAPGMYVLHLVANPGGSCQTNEETSKLTLFGSSLTYILLATE
jgi:hypothetical protein